MTPSGSPWALPTGGGPSTLDRPDPDVTLDAERRQIGGLGILMAKRLMDDIQYEYRDGQNILTLRKNG